MYFRNILSFGNGNTKKPEPKKSYGFDFSGPCGKRIDRCQPYMEHATSPVPKKHRTACETCEENPQLD